MGNVSTTKKEISQLRLIATSSRGRVKTNLNSPIQRSPFQGRVSFSHRSFFYGACMPKSLAMKYSDAVERNLMAFLSKASDPATAKSTAERYGKFKLNDVKMRLGIRFNDTSFDAQIEPILKQFKAKIEKAEDPAKSKAQLIGDGITGMIKAVKAPFKKGNKKK